MLDYISTKNQLHVRNVDFGVKEYFFVLQVVLGERIDVAYANTFDVVEFNRNIQSEYEEDYLSKLKKDANALIETHECSQLKEYLETEYTREIQEQSSTLKDFRFTGSDVQKILNNLLRDRTVNLSESSVRDITSILKMMYENGTLDSDDSFNKHWIHIYPKFNALCTKCNREFECHSGVGAVCPHCGAQYIWDSDSDRFYPTPSRL